MTIRRNIDLSHHNARFAEFEAAVEGSPEGCYNLGRHIKYEIGEACDDLLRAMTRIGAPICNCDGIREIEVLTFERCRAYNTDTAAGNEIEQLIHIGRRMLGENLSFYQAEVAERLAYNEPPEVAEQQADGTWAVMSGGGFMKGGFLSKITADEAIRRRAEERHLAAIEHEG